MSRFAVSVMFRPGTGQTHRPGAKGAGRRGVGARAGVPRFAQQRPGTAPATVKPVRTNGRIARRPDAPIGESGVTTRPSRASAPRRLGSATSQEAVPLRRPAGRVSRPGDAWELEAERLARVVSAPGSSATSPVSGHVRPAPPVVPPRLASVPEPVPAWADPGAAQPLAPALRRQIEAATSADLRAVRVHRGSAAERAAASVRARAFVQGSHIFLGRDQRVDDASVVAHEAAHTIQQSAALNAAHAHGPPAAGPGIQLTRAPPGMVQRIPILSDIGEAIVDVGEAVYEAGSTAVGVAGDLISGDFWGAVRRLAPSVADILEEIADKGLWEFLKEKIGGVVDTLFGGLRQVGDFFGSLRDWVAGMLGTIREVLAGLAGRGKEALFGALRSLRAFLGEVAGLVWDSLTDFFRPVGDFFSRVANFFTGSVLPFLEELGGEVWSTIKRWAGRLWDALEPVRDLISSAWDFVLDLLGLGGGGGGGGGEGGGILGWIQDKAGEVWDWIKGLTAPVVGGIRTVLRWLGNLAPLETIRTLRDRVLDWVNRATQMADRMEKPDGVAEHREVLRDVILPGILGAIQALRGGISAAGHWVQGTVGGLAESVAGFFDTLAGNEYLAFASGALEWLRDGATQLGAWATEGIGALFGLVDGALATLAQWVEPVLNLVRQLIATLFNLLSRLPDLVLGPLWRLIPAWICEPVKNFLINQVLRRIPVFSQLLEIPNLVDRALAVARRVLLQVFLDGDLMGAAWTFFRAVLEFFGLPPPLVVNLIRNAARAIGDIVRAPVSFFLNLLRAVRDGFLNFLENFGRHLLNGLADWLFGTLGEAGIRVPREFSLRAVFDVVLQVLGITVDHVFELIERRIGPERTAMLRRGLGVAQEAFRYIQILVTGGPAALWDEIRGQLSGLWDRIVEGVMSFLMERLVATATRWVLSLLDITGIMPVINSLIAIYRAIESFFRYLRQLLEIVNSVLEGLGEIARGVITRGAALVERNLARMLPIAIGFLANQLGLGGLAGHIRRILERLREMVDRALGWLIDRIVAGVQAVAGAVRSAVTGGAAAQPAAGDVRDEAGRRVASRVSGQHTDEEIQAVVEQVLAELRPQGLSRLEWGEPNEAGEVPLLAVINPGKPVGKKKTGSRARTATVVLRARAVFTEPALPLLEQQAGRPLFFGDVNVPRPRSGAAGLAGGPTTGAQLDVPSTGRSGGSQSTGTAFLMPPASPITPEVIVRSWNSGEPTPGTNLSHAERHLMEFLDGRLAAQRLQQLEITINLSPCSHCSRFLKGWLERHPAVQASLSFNLCYVGWEQSPDRRVRRWRITENTTTTDDVSLMTGAGWSVAGPSPQLYNQPLTDSFKERERAAAMSIYEANLS